MGRVLVGGDPERIDLFFYGRGLARMYKGHLSDSAIVAGLLGHREDSPGVKTALDEALAKGIRVTCHTDEESARNPNTVDMRLERGGRTLKVVGITVGGGEILMTELEGFPISLKGDEDGLLVVADERFRPSALAGLLGREPGWTACAGDDGRALYACLTPSKPAAGVADAVRGMPGVLRVFELKPILDYKLREPEPLFSSVEGMLALAERDGCSIPRMAVRYEGRRSGLAESDIRDRAASVWSVMKESMEAGLAGRGEMLAGFVPKGSGARVLEAVEEGRTLGGPTLGRSVARAIAIMETNACSSCIAAAPTAGSCGVVPALIATAVEDLGLGDDAAVDALLVAAIMGTLVAMRASLSGSVGGCQSEIGVASAMGAAALVHLAKGTPRQAAHGMALALKSVLGLICDPVAGPVEVPCIKRNAIGVANALAAADMAIAGLESAIPPDEVIGALANTQRLLPAELKGTMVGGLDSTPTAQRLKEEWERRVRERMRGA